jgi:hypothetical protein
MIRVLAVLAVLSAIAAARPVLARTRRRDEAAALPDEHLESFVVPGVAPVTVRTPRDSGCTRIRTTTHTQDRNARRGCVRQ